MVSFLFQGIYVLQDNMFRLLSQLSAGKQYLDQAPKVRVCRRQEVPVCWTCMNRWSVYLQYLAFTCGLVRGALFSLGVKSIVTAEVSIMPASKTCSTRNGPRVSSLDSFHLTPHVGECVSIRRRARTHTCMTFRRMLRKKQHFLEFDVFFSCLQVNSRL